MGVVLWEWCWNGVGNTNPSVGSEHCFRLSMSTDDSILQGIAELLRCYICMEGLKDTTLCPHCCKLVCFNCVTVSHSIALVCD